jgi:hypothetical protein
MKNKGNGTPSTLNQKHTDSKPRFYRGFFLKWGKSKQNF